ncbi:MAG: hypothetical protein GQ572_09310 [Gammaproteobacteria bacterium]|nr:hypothetical protein [Gammaproteobacteria bacterium]
MSQISNDAEFKQALQNLDSKQQRTVAALFVEHVLALSDDDRIKRAIKIATDNSASEDEISDALRSAKSAIMDSSTRCGAEGNWTNQAGYFVARAAVAAMTPVAQSKSGGPAWQAAMSSRMAQTSILIDNSSDEVLEHSENEWQYGILSNYLNS